MSREKAVYEKNRVMLSFFPAEGGGVRIFFCPKVKVLSESLRIVVGKKYDVSADLQPYLLKKYRKALP